MSTLLCVVGRDLRARPSEATMLSALAKRKGVVALLFVGSGSLGTVYFVHQIQTRERQTMRQAVLRDIEKLEKRGK